MRFEGFRRGPTVQRLEHRCLDFQEALAEARAEAINKAVAAGAKRDTVEVVEIDEVPLTYLPSNATLVRVKAVGDLAQSR